LASRLKCCPAPLVAAGAVVAGVLVFVVVGEVLVVEDELPQAASASKPTPRTSAERTDIGRAIAWAAVLNLTGKNTSIGSGPSGVEDAARFRSFPID
jgi:hypothetical protein